MYPIRLRSVECFTQITFISSRPVSYTHLDVYKRQGIIWFVLKMTAVFFMFGMVKAFVPRYRYDQLMRLGWKVFLPISLFMVVVVAGVLQYTGWAGGH